EVAPKAATEASASELPVTPAESPTDEVEKSPVQVADEAPASLAEPPVNEWAEPAVSNEQTVTVVVQNTVETYTDALAIGDTAIATSDAALSESGVGDKEAVIAQEAPEPEAGTAEPTAPVVDELPEETTEDTSSEPEAHEEETE